ncbi:hypothetical protein AeRB84_021255 [Aphanomyces euteiches]|nr:hypothetical protein AeRB84_021255 [Aphanomyces euteiches]
MSKNKTNATSKDTRGNERARWTDDKDATWLKELYHQVHVLGKRSDSGFKKEAWNAALVKHNGEHRVSYNKDQLKARHNELKKQYSVVSSMLKTSGIGFDVSTCRFSCLDGSWSNFLEGQPESWAVWESKQFPNYLLCNELWVGTVATGEYASSSSAPRIQTVAISDPDDEREAPSLVEDDVVEDNIDDEQNDLREGKKRRLAPGGSKSVPRDRESLGSIFLAEIRGMKESGEREVNALADVLRCIASPKISKSQEGAAKVLQRELEGILDDDDLLIGMDVLENPTKASCFLQLSGQLRKKWIVREIKKLQDS